VIDVWTGGGSPIAWDRVNVPAGIRIIDRRDDPGKMAAHGNVFDMATHEPIVDAEVSLKRREGYKLSEAIVRGETDEWGAFRFNDVTRGEYVVEVSADGYVPRTLGGCANDDRTAYEFAVLLSREGALSGTVTDNAGKPLAGVTVTANNPLGLDGQGYTCKAETITNDDGAFELTGLPTGFVQVRCRAESRHQKTSIFDLYKVPSDRNTFVLEGTGTIRGKVVFEGGPTDREVHVHLCPPGGSRVGTWGGGARCEEDGSFKFDHVPPGEYLVSTNAEVLQGEEAGAARVAVEPDRTQEIEVTYWDEQSRRNRKKE
jgi:hypothetical protein